MDTQNIVLRSGGAAIDEKRVIDRDQCATVTETHSAVVFFAGDRAYKLKKPVNLGFLDCSAPEARAAACQREAEPNRRFAPDVYLGVMEVFDSARMARVTMLRCTTDPSCDNGRIAVGGAIGGVPFVRGRGSLPRCRSAGDRQAAPGHWSRSCGSSGARYEPAALPDVPKLLVAQPTGAAVKTTVAV